MKVKNMLKKVGTAVSKKCGRTGLKVKKYAPEIWLGVGIATFGGALILAGKETLEAQEVLKEHQKMMHQIEEAKRLAEELNDPDRYTEDKEVSDKKKAYLKTTVNMVKTYAPVVAAAGLSLACIMTSRNILHGRYTGALAAYDALSGTFKAYRKRVKDEYGDLMDRHFLYGTELTTEPILDENGKKTKEKRMVESINTDELSDEFSVWFDEGNVNWDPDPQFSKMFLRGMQNMANDVLHSRGHIFMNEVYDLLGFKHTTAGSVTGWIMGAGDDYVDFGLSDDDKTTRRFVNGKENIYLLNFNHDGIIYNKI